MEQKISTYVKIQEKWGGVKGQAWITIELPIGELTIKYFKIIQKDNEEPWVAFPQISFKSKESGEYVNLNIIETTSRLHDEISEAILTKYQEKLAYAKES